MNGTRICLMAAAIAATAGAATPSIAQSYRPALSARAHAIQVCSGQQKTYPEYTWGDREIEVYRSCMSQHGQPE